MGDIPEGWQPSANISSTHDAFGRPHVFSLDGSPASLTSPPLHLAEDFYLNLDVKIPRTMEIELVPDDGSDSLFVLLQGNQGGFQGYKNGFTVSTRLGNNQRANRVGNIRFENRDDVLQSLSVQLLRKRVRESNQFSVFFNGNPDPKKTVRFVHQGNLDFESVKLHFAGGGEKLFHCSSGPIGMPALKSNGGFRGIETSIDSIGIKRGKIPAGWTCTGAVTSDGYRIRTLPGQLDVRGDFALEFEVSLLKESRRLPTYTLTLDGRQNSLPLRFGFWHNSNGGRHLVFPGNPTTHLDRLRAGTTYQCRLTRQNGQIRIEVLGTGVNRLIQNGGYGDFDTFTLDCVAGDVQINKLSIRPLDASYDDKLAEYLQSDRVRRLLAPFCTPGNASAGSLSRLKAIGAPAPMSLKALRTLRPNYCPKYHLITMTLA